MLQLYDIKELPECTFTISFNLINCYYRGDPFLMEKLKYRNYTKGSFRGGQRTIELVTYNSNIVITKKLQKYVVQWYHTYFLHPGLDRTEAMICQHLYWPGIREAIQKEVTNCDVCQLTKRSTEKYGKLPAKLSE